MTKEQTLTSIDSDIKRKAKQANINMSGLLEDAIERKLNIIKIEANQTLTCHFCGHEGEKETADDVKESIRKAFETNSELFTQFADKTKLTWLCPQEVWICNRCLLNEIRNVSIAL